MAQDIQKRVQAGYGKTLGVGLAPSVLDVEDMLEAGQWDIINKIQKSEPEALTLFAKVQSTTATDAEFAGHEVGSNSQILEAVYTPDTSASPNQYTKMRILTYSQALAFNGSSLHTPALYSPCFYVQSGNAYAVPRPAAGKTAKVYWSQISVDGADTMDITTDTTLDFPHDYLHLVIKYAVANCFLAEMSKFTVEVMTPPARPVIPGFESVTQSLPSLEPPAPFAMPSIVLENDVDLSSLVVPTLSSVPTPEAPDFTDIGDITVSSITYPEYESPAAAPLYSNAEALLDDEDIELVDARMKIISGQLNEYKLDLEKSKAKFAVGTAKYQAEMKKAVIDGQAELARETKEYESRLKLYQIDVQSTLASYEKSLTGYVQEATVKIKEYASLSGVDLKKYETELQTEASRVKSELARIQSVFAQSMKKYEADLQTVQLRNKDKISKFMIEMQLFTQEYNAMIKEDTGKAQKKQMEYTWLANRFQQVYGDYLSYFRVQSKRMQQQQMTQQGRGQ